MAVRAQFENSNEYASFCSPHVRRGNADVPFFPRETHVTESSLGIQLTDNVYHL